MGKGYLDQLPKADIDRHFPEKNGGKGAHARKSTAESRQRFRNNYDLIFRKDSNARAGGPPLPEGAAQNPVASSSKKN